MFAYIWRSFQRWHVLARSFYPIQIDSLSNDVPSVEVKMKIPEKQLCLISFYLQNAGVVPSFLVIDVITVFALFSKIVFLNFFATHTTLRLAAWP